MPENQPTPDQDSKPALAPPGESPEVEATKPPAALDATDAPDLPEPGPPDGLLAEDTTAAESGASVDPSAPDVPSVGPAPDAAAAVADLPPAECAARLAALFPALFTPGAAKPLKLRIQADIQQRAPGIFNKKSLSAFLHRHTTSTAYLRAMVAAPHRIDLDGAPAGELADEHRQAATAELERRRTLHEERRAAERDAQRKAEDERRKALQAQWPARPVPGTAPASIDGTGGDGTGAVAPGARDVRSPPHARPRPAQGPRRDASDAVRPRARPDAPRRSAGEPRRPRDDQGPHRDEPRPAPDGQRKPRDPQQARRDEPPMAGPDRSAPPLPDDPGRRERAMLLRAYESSTLTRANFCVLKRMTEAELDAQLAQARQEAPTALAEFRPAVGRHRR